MYRIRAGTRLFDIHGAEFSHVIEAMDFADMLHKEGFDYAEVVDDDDSLVYYVEHVTPQTPSEREGRRLMSEEFRRKWNYRRRLEKIMTPKELQDEAYATYAENIHYSNILDVMFGEKSYANDYSN